MNRLLNFGLAAILCHPSLAWARREVVPDPVAPALVEYAIEVVKLADRRNMFENCVSERCLKFNRHQPGGKEIAIAVGAWTVFKFVKIEVLRGMLASLATKSLVKMGLTAVGLAFGGIILMINAGYDLSVNMIGPAEPRGLADGLLFSPAGRRALLNQPTADILFMTQADEIMRDELLLMAHHAIETDPDLAQAIVIDLEN